MKRSFFESSACDCASRTQLQSRRKWAMEQSILSIMLKSVSVSHTIVRWLGLSLKTVNKFPLLSPKPPSVSWTPNELTWCSVCTDPAWNQTKLGISHVTHHQKCNTLTLNSVYKDIAYVDKPVTSQSILMHLAANINSLYDYITCRKILIISNISKE